MKNIIKNKWLVIVVFVIGCIVGFIITKSTHQHINTSVDKSTHQHIESSENQQWTCSMHPQIKQNKPGLCPICGMDLVPMTTMESEGEHVDPNEIQMTESALALASVQTTIVKKGIPEKDVQLLGKVKADERNISELTARFGGRIEKLFINYTGQQVRKGEKLGVIYSPDLITAQKELLEAVKYKTSNPSFYRATRSKLKLWDLTEEQIDAIETRGETKTYFDIQSPISGTVTKKHVSIGDYVKEGSPLFEVINLSKVWVMFDAYESDLPWIKKGDDIEFTLQSVPGKQYNGKVTFIDPFIDAQTRVAQVRVELNNTDGQLKPEMFANGILKSNTAQNTNELLIPKSAILWTGKRAVVYVKVQDRETSSFIYRQIILGPEAGNFYVVSDGLSEGEEIAMNGVFKIDAASQLEGKRSMMNPDGGKVSTGHNHGSVEKPTEPNKDHSSHQEMKMIENNESIAEKGSEDMHAEHNMKANLEHAMFKVSGNCEMCKKTIEKAAHSVSGVNSASWDIETKIIHVSYNADKNDLRDIHKAIAKSGYNTEIETASSETYNDLPPCCQYTR